MDVNALPLFALSALQGDTVLGTDGRIGVVRDFLFVHSGWRVRWLVADSGNWLPGRKALIYPSAVIDLEIDKDEIITTLPKSLVERGPNLSDDESPTRDIEAQLMDHFGWEDAEAPAAPGAAPAAPGAAFGPYLLSYDALKGYRLRATDGDIGRVEDVLIEQPGWKVRYFVIATGVWLFGRNVLLAPFAISGVDWLNGQLVLNVTRDQVEHSPLWEPTQLIDEVFRGELHQHYGWPAFS